VWWNDPRVMTRRVSPRRGTRHHPPIHRIDARRETRRETRARYAASITKKSVARRARGRRGV
jgi:hypothetical protein